MFGMKNCRSVWLSTAATIVTVSAGAFTANAFAQQLDATELIKNMNAEIAGLDRFIVRGDAYTDARLAAGQLIEHASKVTLRLRRQPGSIRITKRTTEDTRDVYFDGGLLSVYSSSENFYAQTKISEDVESMLDYAVNEIGIEVPLLDFVSANFADVNLEEADEVRYLGTSLIRDEIFHHIGIRSPEVDVQLWVASEGRPLPGKLVISSKWEGGSPRFVGFFKWDTEPVFARDLFTFTPPDDSVSIGFLRDLQE